MNTNLELLLRQTGHFQCLFYCPTQGNPWLVLCLPEVASVAGLNELSVVCSFIEHSRAFLFSLDLKIESDFLGLCLTLERLVFFF